MLALRYQPVSWTDAAPVDVPLAALRDQWAKHHRHWLFVGALGKTTWLELLGHEFVGGRDVWSLDGLQPEEWPSTLQAPWPDAILIDNLHLAPASHQSLLNWLPVEVSVMATTQAMQLLTITRFTARALQIPIPAPSTWIPFLRSVILRESSLLHLRDAVDQDLTADTTMDHLEWASLYQISLSEARTRWQQAYRAKGAWTAQWQQFLREATLDDQRVFELWKMGVELQVDQGISAYDLIRWARQAGLHLTPVTQRVLRLERMLAKWNIGPHVTISTLARMLYQLSSKSAM
jgi:hypothetical protein